MRNNHSMMPLIGTALVAVALMTLASCIGDKDTTREEFILCKIENVEAMLQYRSCITALHGEHWYESNPGTTDGPRAGVLSFPGGMITDPQPGGMITDPQTGEFTGFHPNPETLEQCAQINILYRGAVESCGEALNQCSAGNGCEYPPPNLPQMPGS